MCGDLYFSFSMLKCTKYVAKHLTKYKKIIVSLSYTLSRCFELVLSAVSLNSPEIEKKNTNQLIILFFRFFLSFQLQTLLFQQKISSRIREWIFRKETILMILLKSLPPYNIFENIFCRTTSYYPNVPSFELFILFTVFYVSLTYSTVIEMTK